MTAHTHPLPGRLRLCFSRLKQQRGLLDQVVTGLQHVAGVSAAEGNASTGGILIHYDTGSASSESFWRSVEAVLLANHLEHDPRPLGRQLHASAGWRVEVKNWSTALPRRWWAS